jgi:hypothetical protein
MDGIDRSNASMVAAQADICACAYRVSPKAAHTGCTMAKLIYFMPTRWMTVEDETGKFDAPDI